jgi:polyisoprenoid-binding protein YceI
VTYRIVPDRSRLRAEARATLHSVRVETSGFEGFFGAEVENGQARLLLPIHVDLSVARLKSGNAVLDGELQHRLEARKFPRVIGEGRDVVPLEKARFRVRAELTLHGVTRSLEVHAAVKVLDSATLQIEGEHVIDMRDFGVDPPKLLFLRVAPRVRVHAVIVAQRETESM